MLCCVVLCCVVFVACRILQFLQFAFFKSHFSFADAGRVSGK